MNVTVKVGVIWYDKLESEINHDILDDVMRSYAKSGKGDVEWLLPI
jgi:hypothetical protein